MMTESEYWPLSCEIGSLLDFRGKRFIPKCAKDIGLGPSIYLLTLKAWLRLFLFLTLLNIPLILLYYSGEEKDISSTKTSSLLHSMLASFTMGNLG